METGFFLTIKIYWWMEMSYQVIRNSGGKYMQIDRLLYPVHSLGPG